MAGPRKKKVLNRHAHQSYTVWSSPNIIYQSPIIPFSNINGEKQKLPCKKSHCISVPQLVWVWPGKESSQLNCLRLFLHRVSIFDRLGQAQEAEATNEKSWERDPVPHNL